jgi:hypothetical protein
VLDIFSFVNSHRTTAAAVALYLALRPAEFSSLLRICLYRNSFAVLPLLESKRVSCPAANLAALPRHP